MEKTILARFFCVTDGDNDMTSSFLKDCGLGLNYLNDVDVDNTEHDATVFIEVKEMPAAIAKWGTPSAFQGRPWDLLRLTHLGAVLYACTPDGDGSLFIPMGNIVAVHSRGEHLLTDQRRHEK